MAVDVQQCTCLGWGQLKSSARHALGLVIGRFQPFHHGHEVICRHALDNCERLLVVLGSGQQARSVRNPWTDAERQQLIRDSLPDIAPQRLLFESVPDVFYNEKVWLDLVDKAVHRHADDRGVCLFGHTKDSSSYYLALFPQWGYEELPSFQDLSATPLREALLAAGSEAVDEVLARWAWAMPQCGDGPLRALLAQPSYPGLCAEYQVIAEHRESWAGAPYPPVFVTVDALVECAGHVLLIQRGYRPGKGLWALPGGFLDQQERLQRGAERELREETGLDLAALAPQLVSAQVYDAPERSDRGRVITHVFHYRLDAATLPAVCGGDDAAHARWWPIADVQREQMFDDHYCVLQHALALY